MNTNIPLLFFLSLIIEFSFTQEEGNCIASNAVETRNDCFAISVANGYCCFNSANKTCLTIQKSELNSSKEYDCGITDENYGKYEFGQYHPDQKLKGLDFETCGKNDPKNKKDCTDYSELSNSCCLFTSKENNDQKSCFHIGRKYIGDFKKIDFEFNGKGYTYECRSFNIIFNLYSILLITLLF